MRHFHREVKEQSQAWTVFAAEHTDLAMVSHAQFQEVLQEAWPEGTAYIRQIATERGKQVQTRHRRRPCMRC